MDGKRLALIVATDTYQDPALRQLVSPSEDADALSRVLGDPGIGDFEVRTLHNASSYEVCQEVEALLGARSPADLVLLHFSCHGIKDDNGELYLAASNTRTSLLVSTAIASALIDRLIQRTRARRVVLLLDCCYGGAFERGLRARAASTVGVAEQFGAVRAAPPPGQGRVVITASDAMEYALEGTDVTQLSDSGPSLFTGALVQGLATGEADRDRDGNVSLGELYDYVYEHVRQRSPSQTPKKWEFGLQGDVHIARNPRPTVVPVALPTELLELASSHLAGSRLAAALDLREVAAGNDLPLALAARRQLTQMVEDDSRRVAATAAEALDKTAIRLEPAVVVLGPQSSGPACDEAVVHVCGPPLARVFAVSSSSSAVGVRRSRDGSQIVVSLAEDVVDAVDAVVDVTSGAGDVALRVTVRSSSASSPATTPTVSPSTPGRIPDQQPARPSSMPGTEPTATTPAFSEGPLRPAVLPAARTIGGADTDRSLEQAVTPPTSAGLGRLSLSFVWTALPVLTFGLLAFVPSLHAAIKLRDRTSAAVALVLLVLACLIWLSNSSLLVLVAAVCGVWRAARVRREVFGLPASGRSGG